MAMARLAPVLIVSLLVALSFSTRATALFTDGTSAALDQREALQRVRQMRRTAHAKALDSTLAAFQSLRRQLTAEQQSPLSPACQNLFLQMATSDCLARLPSGATPANASDVEALCSACVTPLKQFVQQCTTPNQQFLVELLDLTCSSSDGVFCGVQVSLGSNCATEKNATQCAASADCRINPSDGSCEVRPSILCRPCSQNYFRFVARTFGGDSSELSELLCVQSQDGYCLDVLDWFNTTTTAASLPAMLDATICNQANLSQRICWSKLSVAVSRLNQHLADGAYSSCIALASIPGVAQRCVDTWRYASFAAWSLSKATDVICRINSAGQSCAQVLAPLTAAFATCLTVASAAKACDAQCNAEVNQTVAAMGCCTGFLADLRSAVLPSEFAVMQPSGPVPQGIRPTTPPSGVPSNPLAPLAACPSTINISRTINDTCPYNLTSLKAVRRLQLRIRWAYLARNATLLQLIFEALQRDLMTAVGLTATDLAEFNVTEDGSLVLDAWNGTSSTTNHRQMMVQEATTSGAQVTLGIQTNSDAYTNGLASSFDVELAAQTVNLPTTQAVLSAECPQCAADPNGSLIVPPSATAEETSHVGLIVGLVVAGVVVVLLVAALIVFRVKRRRAESEYRKIDDELR